VVAQFADGDPQPVAVTDEHDGVGVEAAQFTGGSPGAGEDLDHEPVPWIAGGVGGGHQSGGVADVAELRQRLGAGGMSRPMIGLLAGASGQSHSMIRSKNTRSIRNR